MKFKMAVPEDVLTVHQIRRVEGALRDGLLNAVVRNFPNWADRAAAGDIAGGEIILQDTDMTQPIAGLKRGVHITISLVSFKADRDFDGLAHHVIGLVKETRDETGALIMDGVGVFVQMTLNQMVTKRDGTGFYQAYPHGENLLEYSDSDSWFNTKPT